MNGFRDCLAPQDEQTYMLVIHTLLRFESLLVRHGGCNKVPKKS